MAATPSLSALPADASAEDTARACLAILEAGASARGLLGTADLDVIQTLVGAVDELAAEADRLADALTESDREVEA